MRSGLTWAGMNNQSQHYLSFFEFRYFTISMTSSRVMAGNFIQTIPSALARYTEDIQGYYYNMKPGVNVDVPNWSTFADLFRGARIYE